MNNNNNDIIKLKRNHNYDISPVLRGGIGNNLFQIATVYSFAIDKKIKFIFEDIYIPGIISHKDTYLGNINEKLPFMISDIFPNIHSVKGPTYYWPRYECQEKNTIDPDKIVTLEEFLPKRFTKTKILGSFSSPLFFDHNRDKIIKLLSFSSDIINYINKKYNDLLKKNTVGVHIRRADYLKRIKRGDFRFCLLGVDYYSQAFKYFDENVTYVFFKEDEESVEWIKKNLTPLIKNYIIINNEPAPVDLCLMSLCSNNIIANSTFSFWGAYLNTNKNRIIVSPSAWKGSTKYKKGTSPTKESVKNKVCADWKIVECECILTA